MLLCPGSLPDFKFLRAAGNLPLDGLEGGISG